MRRLAPFLPLLLVPLAHAQDATWPDLARPPSVSAGDGSRDAALVIAIEDYAFAQDIPGARANGLDWVQWLKQTRRVGMVKPLFNEQGTKEGILTAAEQMASRVQPGGRLWVVYIGHGSPSRTGDDGLLIGVDAQQTAESLETRGLPRQELLSAVEGRLPSDSEVVLLLDACFSGKTSSGDLAPGLAPLKAVGAVLGPRATVLTAARGDQYAGPLSDGRRPAFSYLVLGALRGWGDRDGDGSVSAREAVAYADDALVQTITGRAQTPTLEGPDLALGRSGEESGPDLTALAVGGATAPVTATSAGQVTTTVGEGLDFAALAAQAAAAQAAAADAVRQQAEATAALEQERRRRLDAAAASVRAAAARDYAQISSLVESPTEHGRPVLEAWLKTYGAATVSIDGFTESVELSEVALVKAALGRVSAARSQGGETTTGRSGYEMVSLPGGSFEMGSAESEEGRDSDETQHAVRISRGFSLGKTEVTQGLYRSVVGTNPSQTEYEGVSLVGDELPVQNVSWFDAVRFANALSKREGLEECYEISGETVTWPKGLACVGYRLPTEAEWEYAARAGLSGRYAGTDEERDVCRYGNVADSTAQAEFTGWTVFSCDDGHAGLAPVGSYQPNAWGLYDMTGNVREWTWDWYQSAYQSGSSVDPVGPQSGSARVDRGGCWGSSPRFARLAYRDRYSPAYANFYLGLRLSRTNP